MTKLPPERRSAPTSTPKAVSPRKSAVPAPKDAESARLLVDAEAFLRLGLVDKAIAHLSSALSREPSLRGLRELLLKLYVARRRYPSAVQELRSLLATCSDPQEEIRYLRFLLRLGETDPVAEARLQRLLSLQHCDPAHISAEFVQVDAATSLLEGQLRDYLRTHRPPTDLTQTLTFSDAEAQSNLDRLSELAAATNPDATKIEEVAEEMAYHNGTLKEELAAVDDLLHRHGHDAALRLLGSLAERYPHSKRVQAKLRELRTQANPQRLDLATSAAVPEQESRTRTPSKPSGTAAPSRLREPASAPTRDRRSRRSSRSMGTSVELGGSTIEVDPNDIKEERPAAAPRSAPPPPPGSLAGGGSDGGFPRAYAMASTLRLAGKYEQAISLYHQVSSDPTYGVSAVRMIGLCLRDLDRLDAAVLMLTKAVNLPQTSETELTELFYELGATYEQLNNPAEAILYYQLSLGSRGSFRDATQRIAALQDALLTP